MNSPRIVQKERSYLDKATSGTNDDDDERARARGQIVRIGQRPVLQWAADVADLAAKLRERLGLDGPQIVEALREPHERVEGAALQTVYMAQKGAIKKSMPSFFFTTLRTRREWNAEQVRAYLSEGAASACDRCPTVGLCWYCGQRKEATWASASPSA